MYPHVVQRVNDIRAGRPAPHFVDAPFELQPGESYILESEKFEFNQVECATATEQLLSCC
jgi:hypothetical protein